MNANDRSIKFQVDQSLEEWQVPAQEWLQQHEEQNNNAQHKVSGICSANAVFNKQGKILLVQRAVHDSFASRWELPGGAVDDEDPSILYGAARELYEEAGLTAVKMTQFITGYSDQTFEGIDIFPNRHRTRWFGRAAFIVEVEGYNVRLDPNEHQDYLWVSETEIKNEAVDGRAIPITYPTVKHLILKAFAMNFESGRSG